MMNQYNIDFIMDCIIYKHEAEVKRLEDEKEDLEDWYSNRLEGVTSERDALEQALDAKPNEWSKEHPKTPCYALSRKKSRTHPYSLWSFRWVRDNDDNRLAWCIEDGEEWGCIEDIPNDWEWKIIEKK